MTTRREVDIISQHPRGELHIDLFDKIPTEINIFVVFHEINGFSNAVATIKFVVIV